MAPELTKQSFFPSATVVRCINVTVPYYMHCRAADNEESSFPSSPHLRLVDFEEGARAGPLGLRESQEDGLSRSV